MCTLGEICADIYLQFKYRPIGAALAFEGVIFHNMSKYFLRGDKWDVISAVQRILNRTFPILTIIHSRIQNRKC